MVIQHNLSAMNADRMNGIVDINKRKSSEKLSSGYRINRAADDAAGLAMSEKMRRQIRGLTQASVNAQDGISMVQTAEGALNEVHDMLQRMNELCVKAANDTLTYGDRDYIQDEIYQISDELDRIGTTTRFNEIKLFDGLPQPLATFVVPTATINGATGTIHQASNFSDAYYTIPNIEYGDIAFLPGRQGSAGRYYKAATEQEIQDYQNAAEQQTGAGGTFVERDGTTSDKAILLDMEDFHTVIAGNLADCNVDANSDIAYGAAVGWKKYEAPDPERTVFGVHLFGPLPVTLQVGSEAEHTYSFNIYPVSASTLGVMGINVKDSDGSGARDGIAKVKSAIEKNSLERARLGAVQNRLDHIIKNLDNVVENTTAAESKLRDTDMASEMQYYSNTDIIAQAGQTLLAQANQSKQGVMSLLQ